MKLSWRHFLHFLLFSPGRRKKEGNDRLNGVQKKGEGEEEENPYLPRFPRKNISYAPFYCLAGLLLLLLLAKNGNPPLAFPSSFALQSYCESWRERKKGERRGGVGIYAVRDTTGKWNSQGEGEI